MQASEAISSTSMRYISENIQFSRMKNAIFPQVTAQLYSYGFNDIVSDIPVQIDSKLNAYDSSFCMDSSLYTQNDHLDGVFDICSQSPIHYQPGPSSLMTIKRFDCPFGANHLTTKSTVPPHYENSKHQQLSYVESLPGHKNGNAIRNTRKRPMKQVDVQNRTPEILVGNKSSQSEWTKNKKMEVCFQEQLQDDQLRKETKEVQREKVPVRRSQKLADRVTALQKLVSPYGKTDTASVLHEASIFIKVLQDQIENMVHVLRTSTDNESPQSKTSGQRSIDLQSKGLCLVPVPITQKIIKEDSFNQCSTTMINSSLPQDNSLTL